MSLNPEMTLDQFCEEMQHRVVKHPLGSRAVREALHFARQQKNPEFYRLAADKIHAQRQFQREMFGPTRLERISEFFSAGSLREVGVTAALIVCGVLGVEVTRRTISSTPEHEAVAQMDVDELAERLGLLLEASKPMESPAAKSLLSEEKQSKQAPRPDTPPGQLSDADVQRIAEAVIHRLQAASFAPSKPTGETSHPAAQAERKPEAELTISVLQPSAKESGEEE